MISYFDELKLAGKAEGRIEGRIEVKIEDIQTLTLRNFSFCPPELIEKCVQINDFEVLERIWNYALFRTHTIGELVNFVDKQIMEMNEKGALHSPRAVAIGE